MSKLLFKFYRIFNNRSIVPRWLVFMVDLNICAIAVFFAYWLRFNFDIDDILHRHLIRSIVIISSLNLLFFKLFRMYSGIIRLSGIQEIMRCVWAVFCSFIILLLSLVVSDFLQLSYIMPTSVLLIYFFSASFLLVMYRLAIKGLYHKGIKGKIVFENAVIYGKFEDGGLLKSAIESIGNHQYKVVGFIGDDKSLYGKSIDDAQFYSIQKLKLIVAKYAVKICFISAANVDNTKKKEVIDFCVTNNISVKQIPLVREWLNGQLRNTQLKNFDIESLLGRPGIHIAPEHIKLFLQSKTVLVTGAAGSIGSELVKQLLKTDIDLLVLCDNRESGLYDLQFQISSFKHNCDIEICVSDVRNKTAMAVIFEKYHPNIIFHAAAYKHVPLMEMQPSEAVRNNVMGTKIVADLAVQFGAERFVLISSDKAVNPTNVMGATKRVAEIYLGNLQHQQYKLPIPSVAGSASEQRMFKIRERTKFIITRFGNVLGSNGSVIPLFQQQIEKGGPVTVTHPDIIRYFMTIPEACSLVLEACTMGKGGEIFVFDMGEAVKISDLAKKMIRLSGYIPEKEIFIEFTGLRPGEKLYEELLNNNEEVLPTHHEKIMISKVSCTDLLNEQVLMQIDKLIDMASVHKDTQVVTQLKIIVREYKSKNSTFEVLDEIVAN